MIVQEMSEIVAEARVQTTANIEIEIHANFSFSNENARYL